MDHNGADSISAQMHNIEYDITRFDRIIEKLEQNNANVLTLCTEIKTLTLSQGSRLDMLERDNMLQRQEINDEKMEFNSAVRRIHEKIESSEEKNEKKIDYAIEKLSGKIDGLCEKTGQRIDKIDEKVDKFDKFKWIIIGGALVIGGLFTKFEILKNIFGA